MSRRFSRRRSAIMVGVNDVNPSEGKISDESPIGKALSGHAIGDVVEAEAPNGSIAMKVLEISKA